MRIKRFIAPDMRTALRLVREEQGPDAVILSNRATEGGIEIVAATDYDESLVTQALRAALPTLETAPVATPAVAPVAAPVAAPVIASTPEPAMATAMAMAAAVTTVARPQPSLVSRARAVFKVGDGPKVIDGPTLAELTAAPTSKVPAAATMPVAVPVPVLSSVVASVVASDTDYLTIPEAVAAIAPTVAIESPVTPVATEQTEAIAAAESVLPESTPPQIPALRPVATTMEQPDPALVSMRAELSSMRQLIEKQMEQLSLERLRGSPARAAAYEALLEYGCDDMLAQAVAAKIDPRLEPARILEPMLAELARMLTIARSETIDDGGVIALVGPTGSGKTTTAAKLAARFAARHRARDVALVTIDGERAGAREQLHAHGRRLGITVCEAAGPDGLQTALAQLTDYPLVIVDTPGYAPRDRGLFGQILWLHQSRNVRSLLVLPANAHPHDLGEVVRRYGPAAPEGVVLTKVDEAGRMGSALSVTVRHGLTLAYTTHGQNVPDDIDTADATRLARTLEKVCRAADNTLAAEDRHAVA